MLNSERGEFVNCNLFLENNVMVNQHIKSHVLINQIKLLLVKFFLCHTYN